MIEIAWSEPMVGLTGQVVVMKPQLFEEVSQIAQGLVDHRSVVLNLKLMDPEQAQRAVDFIAGFTWAMKGHQEQIDCSIFLFSLGCRQEGEK